jgi:hypothetical protein
MERAVLRLAPSSVERERRMFILKILSGIEEDSSFGWVKAQGAYPSLEAAIAAAINAEHGS